MHPTSQVIAQCVLAKSACMRRDGEAALRFAQEGIRLSQAYGLSPWKGLATAFHGWALAEGGEPDQGLAQLRAGAAAWRAAGALHFTPFLLALQAEAALKAHETEVGRAALTDGLAIASGGGDTYWVAELHRLTGELSWAAGEESSTVEAFFREAQAAALNNRGLIHQRLGRWDAAPRRHADAVALYEVFGDRRGQAKATHNQGEARRHLRQLDEAEACFRRTAAMHAAAGDEINVARSRISVGIVLHGRGQTEQALEIHCAAAPLFRRSGDRPWLARTINNQGIFLATLNRALDAAEAYEQAAQLHHACGDAALAASSLT